MIYLRTLDGTMEDIVDPSFRKITFDDEAAIIVISTHLRHARTALPADDGGTNSVLAAFIKSNHSRSAEERKAVPQNPDVNTLHTPWRNQIYRHWNHVFWDVSNFLGELSCTGVHMHPPSQDVFALDYQIGAAGVQKVWETDILAIPAYLAPGVSVRFSMLVEEENSGEPPKTGNTLGTFDGTNSHEIWYVKRNTAVAVHIDSAKEGGGGHIAAVIVYGILCRAGHGEDDEA